MTGSGANPAAGSDFAGAAFSFGHSQFRGGETSKTITVNVAGNTVVEPDEGFTVTLSTRPPAWAIGTATASGCDSRNDDASLVSLSISALSADKVEGQSGSTPFTFLTGHHGGNTSIATSASWAVTGSGANPATGVGLCRCGPSFGHCEFRGGRDQQDDHRQRRWQHGRGA